MKPSLRIVVSLTLLLFVVVAFALPGGQVAARPLFQATNTASPAQTATPNSGTYPGCWDVINPIFYHHTGSLDGGEYDSWWLPPPPGFSSAPYSWSDQSGGSLWSIDLYHWGYHRMPFTTASPVFYVSTDGGLFFHQPPLQNNLGGDFFFITEHTTHAFIIDFGSANFGYTLCPASAVETPLPTATPTATSFIGPSVTPPVIPPGCAGATATAITEPVIGWGVMSSVTTFYRGFLAQIVEPIDDTLVVHTLIYDGATLLSDSIVLPGENILVDPVHTTLFVSSSRQFNVRFCPAFPATSTAVGASPSPTIPVGIGDCVYYGGVVIHNASTADDGTIFLDRRFTAVGLVSIDFFFTFGDPGGHSDLDGMLRVIAGPVGSPYVASWPVTWPDPFASPAHTFISFPASPVLWRFHLASYHTGIIGQTVNVRICHAAATVTPTRTATVTASALPPTITPTSAPTAGPGTPVTQTPYPSATQVAFPTLGTPVQVDPTTIADILCDREPCYSFTKLADTTTEILDLMVGNQDAPPCSTITGDLSSDATFFINWSGVGVYFCWFLDRMSSFLTIMRIASVLLFGFMLFRYFISTMRRIGDV